MSRAARELRRSLKTAGEVALAFALAAAPLACGHGAQAGGGGTSSSSGARAAFAAPGWFTAPPKHGLEKLYFVGDSSGSADEGAARDLAIQKALSELTVYCGASVKSDAKSMIQERNGKEQYDVSLAVDVAGDEITVREAVVTKTAIGAGSDGRFDAYVLLEWPKAQYEAVLAMQRQRAKSALERYLAASDSFTKDGDTDAARTSLKEGKVILGPMKSSVPLDHPELKNTSLLWDAMKALGERIEKADEGKKNVFAVAVECLRDAKPTSCAAPRSGSLRQALSRVNKKVSAGAVPAQVAADIVTSESPRLDKSVRSAGFVVAVRYAAELQATDGPFTFVRTSARGVLFDTTSGRIVSVKEITPDKQGHPTYEGAMEKGFQSAERELVGWIEAEAAKIK